MVTWGRGNLSIPPAPRWISQSVGCTGSPTAGGLLKYRFLGTTLSWNLRSGQALRVALSTQASGRTDLLTVCPFPGRIPPYLPRVQTAFTPRPNPNFPNSGCFLDWLLAPHHLSELSPSPETLLLTLWHDLGRVIRRSRFGRPVVFCACWNLTGSQACRGNLTGHGGKALMDAGALLRLPREQPRLPGEVQAPHGPGSCLPNLYQALLSRGGTRGQAGPHPP